MARSSLKELTVYSSKNIAFNNKFLIKFDQVAGMTKDKQTDVTLRQFTHIFYKGN